jgi:hypothetical protein
MAQAILTHHRQALRHDGFTLIDICWPPSLPAPSR